MEPLAFPFVQVVQYDLTSSSEDEHEGSNLLFSSADVVPPDLAAGSHVESDHQTPVSSDNETPVLPSPTVVKDEPPEEVVVLSSDENSADDPLCSAAKRPKIDDNPPARLPGTKAYALKVSQLSDNMRDFLKQVRVFFTKPHSLKRHGHFLAQSTYLKVEERLCCFLGFSKNQGRSMKPQIFEDESLIESYFDYLRDARGLSSATIGNHATSLLYPLKYIHRDRAPDYEGATLIRQLRKQATLLQRQGELDRPKTKEELSALNRWLPWEGVLEACATQRGIFEATRLRRPKAKEAMDLVLLSLYCHIPPSRGLEIRTLEILQDLEGPFIAADYRNRNVVLMQPSGALTLHLQLYKTWKYNGHEQIELEAGSELAKLLHDYVKIHRAELCTSENDTGMLLVNANGRPFTSAAFSQHIKGMFLKLTGCAVSIHALRSAFITWAYNRSDCNEQMKDSLAKALRHSREMAQNTYDRRTAVEKNTMAVSLARQAAEQAEESTAGGQDEDAIKVGDFVAVVEAESTIQQPRILLARVQAFLPERMAALLWFSSDGGSLYSLHLDGSCWRESLDCLVPVSVRAAKGRPHSYRLLTSARTVHKQVHPEED